MRILDHISLKGIIIAITKTSKRHEFAFGLYGGICFVNVNDNRIRFDSKESYNFKYSRISSI
jgi:hypothetical protein